MILILNLIHNTVSTEFVIALHSDLPSSARKRGNCINKLSFLSCIVNVNILLFKTVVHMFVPSRFIFSFFKFLEARFHA